MKQYITKTQWNELTKESQDVLYMAVEPEIWSNNVIINIGQMIEFLGERWHEDLFEIEENCRGTSAWVEARCEVDNLCDELWESVKFKLNK